MQMMMTKYDTFAHEQLHLLGLINFVSDEKILRSEWEKVHGSINSLIQIELFRTLVTLYLYKNKYVALFLHYEANMAWQDPAEYPYKDILEQIIRDKRAAIALIFFKSILVKERSSYRIMLGIYRKRNSLANDYSEASINKTVDTYFKAKNKFISSLRACVVHPAFLKHDLLINELLSEIRCVEKDRFFTNKKKSFSSEALEEEDFWTLIQKSGTHECPTQQLDELTRLLLNYSPEAIRNFLILVKKLTDDISDTKLQDMLLDIDTIVGQQKDALFYKFKSWTILQGREKYSSIKKGSPLHLSPLLIQLEDCDLSVPPRLAYLGVTGRTLRMMMSTSRVRRTHDKKSKN